MKDVETDPDAESEYECLGCGAHTVADSYPGECPDCGDALRNRGTPLE